MHSGENTIPLRRKDARVTSVTIKSWESDFEIQVFIPEKGIALPVNGKVGKKGNYFRSPSLWSSQKRCP
jgi:hypothetical protein